MPPKEEIMEKLESINMRMEKNTFVFEVPIALVEKDKTVRKFLGYLKALSILRKAEPCKTELETLLKEIETERRKEMAREFACES